MNLPFESNFFGVPIAQTWVQVFFHLRTIWENEIKLFIELGMYKGGLLTMVYPGIVLNDLAYLGVEIGKEAVSPQIYKFQGNIRIIIGDIFAEETIGEIRQRISSCNGSVYLFCDGGNKRGEIKQFSEYLRSGDFISVHDYFPVTGGEINDIDLAFMENKFIEIEPEYYKENGLPLWRRR